MPVEGGLHLLADRVEVGAVLEAAVAVLVHPGSSFPNEVKK